MAADEFRVVIEMEVGIGRRVQARLRMVRVARGVEVRGEDCLAGTALGSTGVLVRRSRASRVIGAEFATGGRAEASKTLQAVAALAHATT